MTKQYESLERESSKIKLLEQFTEKVRTAAAFKSKALFKQYLKNLKGFIK